MKKEKIFVFFMFISLFGFILSTILINPLGDLDEIWNYNVARNIAKGLIPYKDISMITTPLLPMITALFLKIIANELIVSRIIAAILWTGILYTVYKIFGELFKEKNVALICTALIGILCRDIYCIDYNVTVLFIALIVLYQELKNINSQDFDKRREFLIRNISRICNMYKTEYRSYTCNNCCRI